MNKQKDALPAAGGQRKANKADDSGAATGDKAKKTMGGLGASGADVAGALGNDNSAKGAASGEASAATGGGAGGGGGGSSAASKLLSHANVSFSFGHADPQGDNPSSAYQNVVDAAAGEPGWTSERSDVGATQVAVSADLLEGLVKAADAGYSININFILGGDHSSRSYHYVGKAVDLHPNGSFAEMKEEMGAGGDSQDEGTHYHYSWP